MPQPLVDKVVQSQEHVQLRGGRSHASAGGGSHACTLATQGYFNIVLTYIFHSSTLLNMYTCINAHIYLYVCMYVCMFIYLRSSMVIQLVRDHEEWNTPRAGRRSLRDGPEGGGGREPGAMPGAGGGPNQNSNSKKLPALYVSEGPRATGGDGTSQTTNQPPPPPVHRRPHSTGGAGRG